MLNALSDVSTFPTNVAAAALAEPVEAPRAPSSPSTSRRRSTTRAIFELDPATVEEALDGRIQPGFEGSIVAIFPDVRSEKVLVMLGAPGVYPDGFKVTNVPRTAPLSEAEHTAVHALVKDRVAPNSRPETQLITPPGSRPCNQPTPRKALSLMDAEDPQPEDWIVPGYIPAGLTLMAGAPKLGKSWLVLDMAVSVARGSALLGADEPCSQGDVLYLAMEDTDRRMRKRLLQVTEGNREGMDRLEVWTLNCDVPTLDQGGLRMINEWCDRERNPRLIIVDTLAKVRGSAGKAQSAYEADYAVIGALQKVAAERGLAVIVVTHTRKAPASDPFECVSGTMGLSGAADATMVIRRSGKKVTLYARGRDIEEMEEGLSFDPDACRWTSTGPVGEDGGDVTSHKSQTPARDAILAALAEAEGEPVGTSEIVEATGFTPMNVRKLLSRMTAEGVVTKAERGRYVIPQGDVTSHHDKAECPMSHVTN